MFIPFGAYTPDQSDYRGGGSPNALNCLPDVRTGGLPSYKSLQSLETISVNALGSAAKGAIAYRDRSGNGAIYAGDQNKLFIMVDTSFSSRTAADFSLEPEDCWAFALFNDKVIAVGGHQEEVQAHTIGSIANFSDLITSTRKPKAKAVAVVRDHVWLGNISDATDGVVPHRTWWSAQNDELDFSPSAATQAGFQDLNAEFGFVNRIIGGEYAIILQERAIWRAQRTVAPVIWHFDEVERARGAIAPCAVVQFGPVIYYLSEDGFYRFDGNISTPIGKHIIDNTFFARLDTSYLFRVTAVADPINSVIIWGYASTGASPVGQPDRYVAFNYVTGEWAEGAFDHDLLFIGRGASVSLDGPFMAGENLDTLTPSLDSSQWKGTGRLLAAISSTQRYATFTGNPLTARFETQDIQLVPGRRTYINAVRPIIEGSLSSSTSVRIGIRDDLNTSSTFAGASAVDSRDQKSKHLAEGRYARFRCDVAGGFQHAIGVELDDDDWAPAGER